MAKRTAKAKTTKTKTPKAEVTTFDPDITTESEIPSLTARAEKAIAKREAAKAAKIAASAPREKTMQEAVSDAIREALPVGIAMAAEVNSTNRAATVPTRPIRRDTCPKCKQPQMACNDEHAQMAVFPVSQRHGDWFQGLRLNGALYLSNSLNHKITVPAANDFAHQLQQWEKNEDEMLNGSPRAPRNQTRATA